MNDCISREAAIEKIRVAAGCAECAGSSSALCVCNVCDVYNAIRLIKSLPATDVEPVRYGRWEGYSHSRYCGIDADGEPIYRDGIVYYCSNPKCRRKTVIKENYCPSCGEKWIWRPKTMTIDRAIEILDPEHREHHDGMDEVNEACRMGMEALERTRWIPCSERLPELQDTRWVRTVIVCARGHVMPMIYERDIVQGKAVGLWKWMWRGIFNEPEAITHWMPLPEPPVKEGT